MMFHVNHEGCRWNHVKLGECRVSASILQVMIFGGTSREVGFRLTYAPAFGRSEHQGLGNSPKLVENIITQHDQTVFFFVFLFFEVQNECQNYGKNLHINYYLCRESDRYSESYELTWFWISQAESSCPRHGRSTIDDLKTYQVCVHKDCQHLHRFFWTFLMFLGVFKKWHNLETTSLKPTARPWK